MARLIFVIFAVLPAILLGIPLQWIALRFSPGYARTLPVWFHRYLMAVFGVRVVTRGTCASDRPMLIVSNHVSWLDIAVLGSVSPLSFVAKLEISGWPLFGTLARLQRSIFVDRNRRTDTSAVNLEIATRLKEGDPIVLFAEGTTSDGNRLLPFRSALIGAASAILSQGADSVLLQPLSVAYTKRNGMPVNRTERASLAWYGDMSLAPHFASTLCGGPIDVTLSWGEPVHFDAASSRKAVARNLEAEVRQLCVEARTGRRSAT